MGRGVKLAVCAATIAASALGLVVGGAGQADAAVTRSGAHSAAWFDGQTCRDFKAWQRREDGPRFRRMVRDSGSADTYLQEDVGGWAFAVAGHKPGSVLRVWAGYVAWDCDPRSAVGL
jgi:hypothetical protein